MEFFLAQLINGISLGSIYAMLVTGFTLLLLVGGVFHWAYAHIVVMAMYFSWEAMRATGGGPTAVGGSIPIGVLVAIVSGIALTLGTEPLLRPLAKRGAVVGTFILSMGISIIFTDSWQRLFHHGIAIG
jgi:branched-chain amino acid transport system permease protein